MKENTKYKFFKFEEKHIKDAQIIFWKAFKLKVSQDYIRNKYNSSFLKIDSISTIAYADNQPVAFYGAIPQQFGNSATNYLVAHACDSYTIPEHQKRGLHYHLALKSYELMKKNGIKLVYAFHSENTYYSTKKLNWEEYNKLIRFQIRIKKLPIAKVFNKIGLKNVVSSKAEAIFTPYIISKKDNSFPDTIYTHQLYNEDFFRYKNTFNQHYLIQLNNCIFYLKINSIINVGLFQFDTQENFEAAIKKLKTLATKIGINEILFQVDKNSNQYSGLIQIEKPKDSWLIGYLPFENSLDINDFKFNFADLDTF